MAENLVVCSKCGTINRLPPSRPAIDAKCGKCKAKVFRRASGGCRCRDFRPPDRAQYCTGSRRCLGTLVRTMPHDGAGL